MTIQPRIWDPSNKYKNAHIKSFTYWTWELSYRQHTLGSFIIFLNRKTQKISELHTDEIKELPKVMAEIEDMYARIPILIPDRINYLQLGNKLHHLHFHGIPRYQSPRNFLNKVYIDISYGMPPIWSTQDVNDEWIFAMKSLLATNK